MPTPTESRRILIIRPSALGDVLRSVPVLASLRRSFPAAEIDWLVQDTFATAIAAHPALDRVVPFPRQRFAAWPRPRVAAELRRWFRSLRDARYDLVIDGQGLGRSGLFTWATRAPVRVGYRNARELGWLGYTVRHSVPDRAHAVDRMLALLAPIGVEAVRDLSLYLDETDRAWWASERAERGLDRYALLAPTTRWASKRWPIDRWATLLGPLAERGHRAAVVIGAPGERDQVKPLLATAGPEVAVADLVGEASVGQMMAIIAGADLVIANDSAPLHAAVGFDRPCVGLFGPTDPELVGPYGRADAVVRAVDAGTDVNYRRADDALMRAIGTADVIAAIDRVAPGGPAVPPAAVGREAGA